MILLWIPRTCKHHWSRSSVNHYSLYLYCPTFTLVDCRWLRLQLLSLSSRSGETLHIVTTGWPRPHWCWWPLASTFHATCSCATPTALAAMAMSSDPACERLDPDADKQTSSLSYAMAAMATKDSDSSATNGLRNCEAQKEADQAKRTHPQRPHLSGRKLSLQERGTYLPSGSGRGYTHISPRVARKPTIESKRVSISDAQVRRCFYLF